MGWLLPKHEVRTFKRNTLAAVIFQLRFDPILKVADKVADFQERVRHRFPRFERNEAQNVEITPAGVRLVPETEFRFRARSEPTTAVLGTQVIGTDYLKHHERAVLISDTKLLVDALSAVFSPVSPVRLGLRYLNVIDRAELSESLGRDVQWSDMLTERFARVPGDIADLEGTNFFSEVVAPMPVGSMTVRHGLVVEPTRAGRTCFRLDTDRFLEGPFDVQSVPDMVNGFASDIFQVFKTVAGEALLEWMMSGEASPNAP